MSSGARSKRDLRQIKKEMTKYTVIEKYQFTMSMVSIKMAIMHKVKAGRKSTRRITIMDKWTAIDKCQSTMSTGSIKTAIM